MSDATSPVVGGAGRAFALYMCERFVESHWFTWVTQMSHIPMDVDFHPGPERAKGWVRLQLEATLNVPPSRFNDWFTGHLNMQIEHHLLPTMPRHHYRKVRPLVRALCAKHRIPYREVPLLHAFGAILKALKTSFPRVVCCRDFETGECEHGDEPCRCADGEGLRPLWP